MVSDLPKKHNWSGNSENVSLCESQQPVPQNPLWRKNGLHQSRQDRPQSLPHLSWLHDLRAPATGKLKPGSHAWALNEEESQPFLRQALDLGINFFDTANVYSSGASEEVLGRFLKANTRRESVVIATKVHGVMRDEPNGCGLSRKAIFYELDQSLRRLGNGLRRSLPDSPLGLRNADRGNS